jgi:hypothetical protein
MPINTKTKSEMTHRTAITGCDGLRDGGKQRLLEAHDLIHEKPGQTGRLIVDYSQGAICNMVFEEHVAVSQAMLEGMNNNGNELANRGSIVHFVDGESGD